VGAILAAVMGVLGLWLWGKHQQAKLQEAEARAEVAETTLEVKREEEQRHEKVDNSSPMSLWITGAVSSCATVQKVAPPALPKRPPFFWASVLTTCGVMPGEV